MTAEVRKCALETCETETTSVHGYCRKHRSRGRSPEEREREAARLREWNANNREHVAEKNRRFREENPDYASNWRVANRERIAMTGRAWYEANRERKLAAGRAWYQANREWYAEMKRAWRAANPMRWADMRHVADTQRRLRIDGQHTDDYHPSEIFARDKGVCHLCGNEVVGAAWWRETGEVPPRTCWNVEHVVPVCRGGTDGWDNVAVSHVSCNAEKPDDVAASFFDDVLACALAAYETFHGKQFDGPIIRLGVIDLDDEGVA